MKYCKGQVVKGVKLLEPTTVRLHNRTYSAWVCQVEDKIQIIRSDNLSRRTGTRTLPRMAEMHRVYMDYQYRCKKKNFFFGLTKEEFYKISQQNCTYCEAPPANGVGKPFVYNGVDRMDNSKGYTLKNSVPCCAACNSIKTDRLTFDEMKVAMRAVLKFRKG